MGNFFATVVSGDSGASLGFWVSKKKMGGTLNDNSEIGVGDDQQQTAAYIFDMLIGLSSAARQTDLTFLAYLLEMAGSEASRVAETKNARGKSAASPRAKRASR